MKKNLLILAIVMVGLFGVYALNNYRNSSLESSYNEEPALESSDEISVIEAELKATKFEDLDAEMAQILSELE